MDKHTLIQAVTKKYWNTVNDERPSSIAECYDDETGSLDGEKYDEQRAKEDELEALDRELYEIMYEKTEEESTVNDDSTSSSTRSRRTKRQKKSLAPYYFDDAGNRIEYKPVDTLWYIQYVRSPMIEDAKFLRQFRRRFRIPYVELAGLVEEVLESGMFTRWQGKDAVGCDSSPIELLVLGTLRYLGRGLTFDDLEEYTAINEETHRQFFHRFIEFGATVLHAKYVRFPRNAAEYGPHQEEFTVGGLNGAGFSTDATNVIMWNCVLTISSKPTWDLRAATLLEHIIYHAITGVEFCTQQKVTQADGMTKLWHCTMSSWVALETDGSCPSYSTDHPCLAGCC